MYLPLFSAVLSLPASGWPAAPLLLCGAPSLLVLMWSTLLHIFSAGISFNGVVAVASFLRIAALLRILLTKLLDRQTERLKDERAAKVREKERQHEASERKKERQHEKELALIAARAHEGKYMTLAA